MGKEGKKKIKAEAVKKIEQAKALYVEKVNQLNMKKTQNENLSPEEVAKINESVAQINAHYAELEKNERQYLETILLAYTKANNEIHVDYNAKKDEKSKNYQEVVKTLAVKYEEDKKNLTDEYNKHVSELKEKLSTAQGEEIDKLKLEIETLASEYKLEVEKVKDDYLAALDEVTFESKCFYGIIDGLAMSSTNEINQKIVKSLGANLFSSTYRFEVAHDAYTILQEEDKGIKTHVNSLLDYGSEKYLVCTSNGRTIYLKSDDESLIGKDINLSVDITKTKIFENKFDIRLY